jgi:hypothetical protein
MLRAAAKHIKWLKGDSKMNRRAFLKTTGIGSASLAAVPTLVTSASAASPVVGVRFVSNSRTATAGGVRHLAQFNGDGRITHSEVEGGGVFNLVVDTSPVPKTIEASGTWTAKRLTSFTLMGTYGSIASGILQMDVRLVPNGGSVVEAKLRVVCNLAAAGLNTGEEEGFVLDIPGTPFTAGGMFGPFEPFTPVPGGPTNGLSVFNVLNQRED